MVYKNKSDYLNFGCNKQNKIFKDKSKLAKLIKFAKTKNYSARRLSKIFKCNNKTILRVLYINKIIIPNLGKFKKIYTYNEKFFNKLNKNSAYWAGFIAADGCLCSKKGRGKSVSIGLNVRDDNYLTKFINILKSDVKINYINSNNSAGIRLNSGDLFDSLFKLGITPNKSLTIKKVNIPSNLLSHFIRGVYDGDGSISGNRVTHIQLCIAGNKPFLEWIQNILVKNCKINKVGIYPLQSKAFRLQYTGSQIFRILNFIYKDCNKEIWLDRKYEKYIKFKNRFNESYNNSIGILKN